MSEGIVNQHAGPFTNDHETVSVDSDVHAVNGSRFEVVASDVDPIQAGFLHSEMRVEQKMFASAENNGNDENNDSGGIIFA
jgi:hypothetical protein